MSETTACTTLPWSEKLEQEFTFQAFYDENPTQVFKKHVNGKLIDVPRGGVPRGDWDLRDPGVAINFNSSFKSQKPEQPRVIAESVALLKADKDHIVAAPTGWGKTYVGTEIAGQIGRRFCVITTKEDILDQWVKALQEVLGLFGSEIGIWRGNHVPYPQNKAVVALVQSVMKGPERYGADAYQGFGLVLCDEVHRMGADQFSQAMWHFPSKHRLGMSATPWRKDGKDRVFTWHIGEVMVQANMQVLIPKILIQRSGWKIPGTGGQIPHDFGNISLLMKPMCRNLNRNLLIVRYLMSAYEKGRNTIAFSDNLEHLDIIMDLLLGAGIPEADIGFYIGTPNAVYGSGPKKGHSEIRRQHATRKIVLATYKMASEATNLPWLDTCILMTPRADVEQIVGRIRREYDDKHFPLVVDFVDDDSLVLAQYAKSRKAWYESLGCEIKRFH